ncbi:hypothetical protein CC80DRAFT_543538 [Byssothecium circinans]|uniref:Uncharacterized protein n=1 Tax=Byssothecium circinans TaxID=147558 RepID=A0A6A5UA20_9PLEO|nr:hypothetical protein CC80DRAFT_543538 [Byssothecium circinans]
MVLRHESERRGHTRSLALERAWLQGAAVVRPSRTLTGGIMAQCFTVAQCIPSPADRHPLDSGPAERPMYHSTTSPADAGVAAKLLHMPKWLEY